MHQETEFCFPYSFTSREIRDVAHYERRAMPNKDFIYARAQDSSYSSSASLKQATVLLMYRGTLMSRNVHIASWYANRLFTIH